MYSRLAADPHSGKFQSAIRNGVASADSSRGCHPRLSYSGLDAIARSMQPMPTGISISTHVSVAHRGILWLLFFLICMGLGYPTISRYDPRTTHGLEDTTAYAAM